MTVPSPCVSLCRMDFDSGLCVGCQRTIAEIAAWSKADDAQKSAILVEVAKRRQEQLVETKP